MKLLHLITSLDRSGPQQSLATMAPAMASRGVHLEVAYIRDRQDNLRAEIEDAGIPVVLLAGSRGHAGLVERSTRLIRQRRPDLIHTTMNQANIVGRIAGVLSGTPVVSSLINEAYGKEQYSTPGRRAWQVRAAHARDVITARRVARFHAITRWVADVMGPRLRIPPERIDVVARGRDPLALGQRSSERRTAVRRRIGVAPETPLLVAAARQDHQKGLDVLLEAMPIVLARHPDTHLVVAGRAGDQTPMLEAAVSRLGLQARTRFLGLRGDVPELLCGADAFVLPSRWEALGSVLLEAMALEAPIVTSDLPPVREVVRDETCALLVPPKQPPALAAAIIATLEDGPAATARARRARQRFMDHFTVDRVADEMVAFYHRALGDATPGRTT